MLKQIYIGLSLIGILSVNTIILSVAVPQSVTSFRTYFNAAEKLEGKGDMNAAYAQYGKAADVRLPEANYINDPYKSDRSKQTDAIEKLSDKARELESAGDYSAALKIYQYAPTHFASDINTLQSSIGIR